MRLIDADELITMEYAGIKFVPKEFIDDAPTIEQERKTGEWILGDKNYHCSECGNEPFYSRNIYTLHYCPHCGAKMRGEK